MKSLYKDLLRFKQYCEKRYKTKYDYQEEILQDFVKRNKDHKSYPAVIAKATLLNQFYSTGIKAIDAMSANIMSIKDIDDVLNEPKACPELVHEIAILKIGGKERNNYSFATKYCALHQPTKYPIYDSIVANIFYSLAEKGDMAPFFIKGKVKGNGYCLTKNQFFCKMKTYKSYLEIYDTFMKNFDLADMPDVSYRDVDFYLWGAYKEGGFKSLIEQYAPIDKKLYTEIPTLVIPKQHCIKGKQERNN